MARNSILRAIGATVTGGVMAGLGAAAALAEDIVGKPVHGGTGLQPAATELARDIHWLEGMVNIIIAAICVLVLALIAYAILRFRADRNPEPASFTHNTRLEVTWTLGPILILIFIGAFSLPILFKQVRVPEGDLVIKVAGNQWFWSYEYPDEGIYFDSLMLAKDEMADYENPTLPGFKYSADEYLLAVDNPVVVPVGKTVVLQITGNDVIHSWTVPAFGVKMDAIPGRLNQTWFKPEKTGLFFGQCSELCGKGHAYMPIAVKVVTEEEYQAWLGKAKQEFAAAPARVQVAAAE